MELNLVLGGAVAVSSQSIPESGDLAKTIAYAADRDGPQLFLMLMTDHSRRDSPSQKEGCYFRIGKE